MAVTFVELIKLLKETEEVLIDAGQGSAEMRITTLRGIYYGTEWSMDYGGENSTIRNHGFTVFTLSDPVDPRDIVDEKLMKRLFNAHDIVDEKYKIDFAHIIIGLDARWNPVSRSQQLPTLGGSGLECCTWLGDLGGGAANLTMKRIKNPKTLCNYIFTNSKSDYGASVNLEGNIASYIVASNYDGTLTAPVFNEYETITEKIMDYLPIGSRKIWLNRSLLFLQQIGAEVVDNTIKNKEELIATIAVKIEDFGACYFIQRFVLKHQVKFEHLTLACQHLNTASLEIANVFINALEANLKRPSLCINGNSFPAKSGKMADQCNHQLFKMATMTNYPEQKARVDVLWKEFDKLKKEAVKTLFQ